jgi:hypothetical protein
MGVCMCVGVGGILPEEGYRRQKKRDLQTDLLRSKRDLQTLGYLPEEGYRRRSHAKVVVANNGRVLLVRHEPLRRGVLRNRLLKNLKSPPSCDYALETVFAEDNHELVATLVADTFTHIGDCPDAAYFGPHVREDRDDIQMLQLDEDHVHIVSLLNHRVLNASVYASIAVTHKHARTHTHTHTHTHDTEINRERV